MIADPRIKNDPFFFGQFGRFQQYVVGDADLANIMQERPLIDVERSFQARPAHGR